MARNLLRLRFGYLLGYSLFAPRGLRLITTVFDRVVQLLRLLLTIDLVEKNLLVLLKRCVIENLPDSYSIFLVEIVQIKQTDERREIAVSEILG